MSEYIGILSTTVLAAIASPTILWLLFQRLIDNRFSRDLEEHKAKLKSEAGIQIERVRSELLLETQKAEIIFSSLHAKRAEKIEDLHLLLSHLFYSLESYVSEIEMSNEPSKDEKLQDVSKRLAECFQSFTRHRIYLSEGLDTSIEGFLKELRNGALNFKRYMNSRTDSASPIPESGVDKWRKIVTDCNEIIKPALGELRSEFRRILGAAEST